MKHQILVEHQNKLSNSGNIEFPLEELEYLFVTPPNVLEVNSPENSKSSPSISQTEFENMTSEPAASNKKTEKPKILNRNINTFESLAEEDKLLYLETLKVVKALNYKFIWVHNSKVMVRKGIGEPKVVINSTEDLNRL